MTTAAAAPAAGGAPAASGTPSVAAPSGGKAAPGGQMPSPAGANNGGTREAAPGVQRREPVVERKGAPPPAKADPSAQKPGETQAEWWRRMELDLGEANGGKARFEFNSPEELQSHLRRAEAQNRAFQRKQAAMDARQRALEQAAKDPVKAAKVLDPNWDPDQFALQRVQELYEAQQLTPEQRQIKEYEAKIKEFESAQETREREAAEAADRELHETNQKRWKQVLGEAIKETGDGTPEDASYVEGVLLPAVAGVLFHARQMNPEGDPALDLTPQEVAREVRRLHGRTFEKQLAKYPADKLLPQVTKHLDGLDDATLLKTLGSDRIARIVKAHLESTRGGPPVAAQTGAHRDDTPVRGGDDERNQLLGIKGRAPPRL